ncbi:MAG TPA: FkbM family methyltransferase [Puia sp.]|nr:FkbM family methyltransferase [Puia sp.]
MPVTELYWKIKRYLPENPIILEAGAHMGFDTYGLSQIWPKGVIHAFEPIPEMYDSLVDRLKGVKNVKTYNVALGRDNGNIEMYVSGGNSTASSSILKPASHLELFPSVTFESKIIVPVNKLSDWAEQEGITRLDLLWLDMQGYEVYALEGAGHLLKDVSVIYTELCKNELYSGLITQDLYIEFLAGLDFELVEVTGDGEVGEGIFISRSALQKVRSL